MVANAWIPRRGETFGDAYWARGAMKQLLIGVCLSRSGYVLLLGLVLGACGASSSDPVAVPDVRGKTIAAGSADLQSLRLCVLIQQGSGVDRGPVIARQRPQPGLLVVQGTLVTIRTNTVAALARDIDQIGVRNRELGCDEGVGIPGEEGVTTTGSTG